MMRNLGSPRRPWPLHTPSRKELGYINPKNRVNVVTPEETSFQGIRSIPLKRKYRTYRAYMQAPVGSPGQSAEKRRPYFPMSRQRAIKSTLAP